MAMAPTASAVSFSARPSTVRPRAATASASAGAGRVRAGAPQGGKWWAPLVGWSGKADYIEAAAPVSVAEEEKPGRSFVGAEVGLEPMYIAHRSVILCLSLEGRVRPRYHVLKFLKENVLVDRDLSFHTAVNRPEKYFVEKLISPHKEAAPHLAEDYATACKGEVPTNFRFT